MRTRIRELGLAAHIYQPDRQIAVDAPLAVFAPGLPFEAREESMSSYLVEHGWQVLQVQYPGTYDSDGDFTPDSAIESMGIANAIIENGEVWDHKSNRFVRISTASPVLIGHSFGAWVALRSTEFFSCFESCLAIAPYYAFGKDKERNGIHSTLEWHVPYIHATMPHTIRLSDVEKWNEFFTFSSGTEWDPKKCNTDLKVRTVVGTEDESFDVEKLASRTSEFKALDGIDLELIIIDGAGHAPEEMFGGDRWSEVDQFLGIKN